MPTLFFHLFLCFRFPPPAGHQLTLGDDHHVVVAARILGAADPSVQRQMVDYQARMAAQVERKDEALRQRLMGE